ncbi:MAG TPA: ABC transporter permease [Solirubrobacteraceae bacterium]|jgi:peptide/nickel transport system permease protein|nr:ABC transporter permease [Solirubrobacteraceae bacterium]
MTTGAADILVRGPLQPEPARGGAGSGPVGPLDVDAGDIAARSPLQLFWRRFRSDRVAVVSLGFIALLVVVALAAPLIVQIAGVPGPNVQNPNATDAFGSPLGPSAAHPFGVDQLGRDVFARVLYGTRVSLEVGIIGTALATLIGAVFGLLSGFYGGWVDTLLSRATDVALCFPILLLGLGISAACQVRGCAAGAIQPGVSTIIAIIALFNWTYIARIVRGQVLSLREQEFVAAARSLGASNARIVFGEILPNLTAPLIVYASLLIPLNILLEAALSYLGVGVHAPTASWGQMLAQATPIFNTAWWYMTFPGIALLLTVLAFNLLGDGLQDALNPRTVPQPH